LSLPQDRGSNPNAFHRVKAGEGASWEKDMKKLVFIALSVAGLGVALTACAPRYYDDRYDRYGYYDRDYRGYGDRDRDGVPNRYDRDRDNDGVPNYADRRPGNPYRY
jgi:hypothetical protein